MIQESGFTKLQPRFNKISDEIIVNIASRLHETVLMKETINIFETSIFAHKTIGIVQPDSMIGNFINV